LEQVVELGLLFFFESGAEAFTVGTGCAADLGESFLTFFSDAQDVGAAVVCVFPSDYQTSRLQIINDGYQAAGVHVQSLRELALAHAGGAAEKAENSSVRRSEAERSDAFGKFAGGVSTHLGE
jgi:hypothetical protein